MNVNPSLIGLVAGGITSISMLPQLIKVIKEKKAEDISVLMLLVLITGLSIWIYYGFLKNDLPILITNSFSVLVNCTLLFFRFKYKDS